MATVTDRLMDKDAMSFVDKIGDVFKTLPHLPDGVVEFFVKVAPWLAIISAVLSLLAGPVIGLLGTLGSVLTLNPVLMIGTLGTAALMIINAVLMFMAFKPLQNREKKGWVLMFWAEVLGLVASVIGVVFTVNGGSVITNVIITLLSFYFLFEMRPKYK